MIEDELWVRSEYRDGDDILCVQYEKPPLHKLLEWMLRVIAQTLEKGSFRDQF